MDQISKARIGLFAGKIINKISWGQWAIVLAILLVIFKCFTLWLAGGRSYVS